MTRPLWVLDREAVAEFPELRCLIDLRDSGGWVFFPSNEDGDVIDLRGLRVWRQGYADAFLVRGPTDAAALRADHTGGVVWQCDGTLVDVVAELMVLPPPGTPHSPRLVRGRAPRFIRCDAAGPPRRR